MTKVLVIDDSEIMRELLETYLTDLGYSVVIMEDGNQAIDTAANEHFDLCICDMHLGTMSGHDILNKMRPLNYSMQMIFTDSLPDKMGAKVIYEGNHTILQKPFDLEQLKKAIEYVLESVKR